MSGGGVKLSQAPWIDPGGTMQLSPMQQSALVVQNPPCGTHIDPQCSAPVASGTHGSPLQQSPLNEQLPPAGTHAPTRLQRGMPTLSGWQQLFVEMQAQQSSRTLVVPPAHTGVGLRWHTSPAGSQVLLQPGVPGGQLVLLGLLQVPIFVG